MLELELHGNGDCQGHGVQPAANPGQHKVPPQEVSGEAQALMCHLQQTPGHHEHVESWAGHLHRGSETSTHCPLPSPHLLSPLLLPIKVQLKQDRLSEPETLSSVSPQPPSTGEGVWRSGGFQSLLSLTQPAFVHQQKLQGELNWVLEHHRVRQQALETRV